MANLTDNLFDFADIECTPCGDGFELEVYRPGEFRYTRYIDHAPSTDEIAEFGVLAAIEVARQVDRR